MEKSVAKFIPNVLVVGNNRISEKFLHHWHKLLSTSKLPSIKSPMIIRRGIELGGIPIELSKNYNITLKNIPSINSPYVARHMLNHLRLPSSSNQSITVMGAGDIGLPIIKSALSLGLSVRAVSDSLLKEGKARQRKIDEIFAYLSEFHLNNKTLLSFPHSLRQSLYRSNYVAISVPWWLEDKKSHNKDMLSVDDLSVLSPNATIVSASNPRIFTEDALLWLNRSISNNRLSKVRIDTGHSYADEVSQRYNCHSLDVKAGEAFYYDDCLIRLDRSIFKEIYKHAGLSSFSFLLAMPKPQDSNEIMDYVTNKDYFYDTEEIPVIATIQKQEKNKVTQCLMA
jgi:lactate dehydrogenase-like 2-hydroxyacid dehydrogenase